MAKQLNDLDRLNVLAKLGEALVDAVRETGLLKPKSRRAKTGKRRARRVAPATPKAQSRRKTPAKRRNAPKTAPTPTNPLADVPATDA